MIDYPVFETIKAQYGEYHLLSYHAARMQRTAEALWNQSFDYETLLQRVLVKAPHILTRSKVLYHQEKLTVEYTPYIIKPVQAVQFVEAPHVKYNYKYSDRTALNAYNNPAFSHTVFIQNGLLTDATYSNLALWNGKEWHTPQKPLLNGTKRAYLLDKKLLIPQDIHVDNLEQYQRISFINAMLDLDEAVWLLK